MAKPQPNAAPVKQPDAGNEAAPRREDGRDPLDETVLESFPSSDPGASWAGRDIPPDERKKPQPS